MDILSSYVDNKKELEIAKNRLALVCEYERKIKREKKELVDFINLQTSVLEGTENILRELNGVEQKIFYEIVVNGLNVTKAIESVSVDVDLDISTLWKNYYPRVKQHIIKLKLQKSSENQE